MSDRTDSFLKFIEDVITKKIVYHLFDDEVEFLGCVILSYLLALEITCSCFHDFIDKDLIDLVLPDVRRYVVVLTEAKDSEVCKITRADGTSSFHGDFQALLRRLDRQDLFQLYSLVQERYKHRSIEGHDLDLWGDLKMMFDPNEEDDIWLNQHYWELLRWKLHEYSGVHSLFLEGTSIQINMLVDKKYPLKKEILKKMINLKIEAEEESDMASELIKFIKSQIAEQS
ncbi:hypothetical protein Tco_0905353 [Tanacetum coccineum]